MTIEAIANASAIYFDSNVYIYLVEGARPFQTAARRLFVTANDCSTPIVASELAIAECLYGAHKQNNAGLAAEYLGLFRQNAIDIFPVEMPVLETAAIIGPQAGLKLPDAIHVATALGANCDVFVTNDGRIRSFHNLTVIRLEGLKDV